MIVTQDLMRARVVKGAPCARVPLNSRPYQRGKKGVKAMQQITLKRSTIAAMNQAFQSYCKSIDRQEQNGVDVKGVTKDLNGYLLMVFCRQMIVQSGQAMTAGQAVQNQLQLQYDFERLDDD